ncbi:MAG: ribosomal RNA small subunit methyltransferase A [Chloroflexi bacterium]|nr:ribosomal RNA small subunit methyltransferase A [Chloroflexota bacterium]
MFHRSPKKSLGQHFLTDRNLLAVIADAASISSVDTVIEIGPGRGSLTGVLATRANRVIAIELDSELIEPLKSLEFPNVKIVEGDARAANPDDLLGECSSYKLVGNLPYYAALPIIRSFFESTCRPSQSVFLLQKEVAMQICASPGSYSLASLGVQIFGDPRICKIVKPGSFSPAPKVTSAIVAIESHDHYINRIPNIPLFFKLLRAGFAAPRKQLRNSIALGLSIENKMSEDLLSLASINYQRRAETLSIEEWINLYNYWREMD